MTPDGFFGRGAPPRAVLLVDDDEFIRGLLTRQLTELGIATVTVADSGAAALTLLRAHGPFNLVICDLQMPGMDGVEFLRHLAVTQPGAPVIVISAQDRKVLHLTNELVLARGLRLLGSLPKPVSTHELRRLLAALDSTPQLPGQSAPDELSADDLRAALAAGEIEAHVQPKVGASTRRLAGVEALARWTRADGRVVSPDRFIPLAEQAALMDELTDAILRRALGSCGGWARDGFVTGVAVNVSATTLQRIDLPERITSIAADCGVALSQITLEVTETGVLQGGARALDVLTRLRLRGIALSLDDFGTGYSSLGQLQRLPFSELKIDRSFIASLLTNPESARIVESTIALAGNLGLQVTGEGVETETQVLRLAQLGCDLVQGYFIARPMPPAELPAWARRHGAG